ncbi:SMP-30/gluconolactonase/LRE family protein [Phycicoccus avicenniae]|uniref:SMP-30/gluconolactonase/LRE family protein n=1 Tax=Phycicoccus avicenniae TaxID=2828860 RepID=UPI003D27AEB6
MKRTVPAALAAAALTVVPAVTTLAAPASAHARPTSYTLTGDPGGSKFEGIGADTRRGLFYVSEVTGGEIHRGSARSARTEEWLAGDGTDGRFTARGITVDRAGRVYVAGGPNGIGQPDRPDLWVYSPSGRLLAALRAPGDDVFLNDVAIGPDGAAYFTNSNAPQVYRVAQSRGGWTVSRWADATGTVPQLEGFNLGGIVVSADRSALVVAQGTTGRLWRFALRDGSVSEVATGGADLTGADGLVRQGHRLLVVRNFQRFVATLTLTVDGRRAGLVSQRPTDPTRVLTTAKVLRGRILFVDSKFDETVATPPYEVVTDPYVG